MGEKEYIHTHAWQWMDALRCASMDALRCNAMRCNGMEMGRDFAVVVSCLFLLLLFKERARLIGAAAAAIAGCPGSQFECNAMELK